MLVILLTCRAFWSGEVASQQHLPTPPAIPTYLTPERGADTHWLANVGLGAAKRVLILQHWKTHGLFTNCLGVFRKVLNSTSIKLPRGQASHVLRHTFASHFVMNGGHIVTLQHIPGHASLSMTMRYAHLSKDHLADAVKLDPLTH